MQFSNTHEVCNNKACVNQLRGVYDDCGIDTAPFDEGELAKAIFTSGVSIKLMCADGSATTDRSKL